MEGSRILALKRANQEGAAPVGVLAAPAASSESPSKGTSVVGDSPIKGTASGKENSPQQPVARPLGRVREAALALERLARAETEQGKAKEKGAAGSKEVLCDESAASGPLRRGPSLSGPLVVEQQLGQIAAGGKREGLDLGDAGEEGKRGMPDTANLAESCRPSEGIGDLAKQHVSPVSDTPKTVSGPSTAPWGTTLLRSTRGKIEEGVMKSRESEPATAVGTVTRASVAAGGRKEEEGRLSVRSLLQMWTRQEASAVAPASQPKSAVEVPPAAPKFPPGQPAKDLSPPAQEVGPTAPVKSTGTEAGTLSNPAAPQNRPLTAAPAGELRHGANKNHALKIHPDCGVQAGAELVSVTEDVDTERGSEGEPLGGELPAVPKAPVTLETEPTRANQGCPTSSPPGKVAPSVQDLSPVKAAAGATPAAGAATLATPPGVAGVFFRPKRVAWRAGAMEGQSAGARRDSEPGGVSEAAQAGADVSNRKVELGLEKRGAMAELFIGNTEAARPVPTPAKEAQSPLDWERPGHDATSPTAAPSPLPPAVPSPVRTLVQDLGSVPQAVPPTSPPPTLAAAAYFSPASLKRGLPLDLQPTPGSGDGSSLPALRTAAPGSPAVAECLPAATGPQEEATSPVAHHPLLPASSFFSPLSAKREATRAVGVAPPSFDPQTLYNLPGETQPALIQPNDQPATPVGCVQRGQPSSGEESPPTSPASLPPASPRLASASPFFSPQAVRKPSTPGVTRSLFSAGGVGDAWGAGSEATADLEGVALEGPKENGEGSADGLEEVGEAVRVEAERIDSPPPSAASLFFSPRKIAPSKPRSDLQAKFGGLVSSGSSEGYPEQIQEPDAVLLAVSPAPAVNESNSLDDSASETFDAVRPISPPPARAAGFFSPSKPAFPRAFNPAEDRGSSSHAALGAFKSAPLIVPDAEAELFFDPGGEATPYASANCSPLSVAGSSPGSARCGPSRRVWEVVEEEAPVHLEEPQNQTYPGNPFATVMAVAADEGPAVGQPVADTWQLDRLVTGVGEGASVAREGKRSELGSSHVSSWDSPDHQKVRTPPYRSGARGMGMWGQEAGPAPFRFSGAGLLVQAERNPEDEGVLAGLDGSKQTVQPRVAAAESGPPLEADESVLPPVTLALTGSGNGVEASGPSAEDLTQHSRAAPKSTAEAPIDLALGGTAERQVFSPKGTPPPAKQAQAAGPQDTTPSPSKPGLWSTLVGGLRGMITPPKFTPPKFTPPKFTPPKHAASTEESGAVRKGSDGPIRGAQAEVAPGGAFRPAWASPHRKPQTEGTRETGSQQGEVVSGGGRKGPNTFATQAAEKSHWTAPLSPTPASQPACHATTAANTPIAQNEPRGALTTLPAGSPERQRSASPRTPPLASAAFGFASRIAAPQTTPVGPATSQPQPVQSPPLEPTSPEPQPEPETPAEVDFSPWERMQMAAIFEHFQTGAASQLGARAFFSGAQQNDGPRAFMTAKELGVEGPVKRSVSAGSADSCFELPPDKVFAGAAESDDCDDVTDPIVRAVRGVLGGSSPLVNYYDVAGTAPVAEATCVEPSSGRIPVSKPVEGEVLHSKPLERSYSGVKKPGRAGFAAAYPWVTDPSPALTRWLQSNRDEEASFWAPSPKPEPIPNWARGAPGKDGAFIGRKAADPFTATPARPNPSGDLQAARPAQESPKRSAPGSPASARTRKGPVPIDQRKTCDDPNKKYFPARVNELRGARGGELPGANQRGRADIGVDAGRDSFLAPAGSPNQSGFAKRGRSASVTDRSQEQRSAARDGLKAFRSLTPLRFRSAKGDPNRERDNSPRVAPLRAEPPSPTPSARSPVKGSPAKTRLLSRRTRADSVPVASFRQGPAAADPSGDKENAGDVSGAAGDGSKMTRIEALADEVVGAKAANGIKGSPDYFDRTLSLRDPNREPALATEYVDMSPKDMPTRHAAAAEAASLWEPAVSDVDPPSAWAHLSPADLVARPLPSDVEICRCYVVREHASKLGTAGLYTLFTEEGEGRQDRQLLVARHVRHVGRSEFVIADSAEKLGDKGGPRCVVRANFVGSKYTAHAPGAEGKSSEEKKLAEIGYATTATSLSPTSRRMLVTLPAVDGAEKPSVALVSKPPVFNQEHKRFEINYGGRAKDGAGIQQSVKNFQLVAEAAEDRTLLLFGKVGKDTFVMDFRPPLTATQAFAICLSSIDSKLCCAL